MKLSLTISIRRGSDKGVTFEYGKNLTGVRRTWQRDNGWSYDINIVDMQKTVGYIGETYGVGDDITVIDKYAKLTLKQRIIAYKECDDPMQNSITVGVFVRDNASLSVETDRIANAANQTANNSVQQGEKYSNVSITHSDGFKAVSKDDTLRVMMNGDDCFVVQAKKNGKWTTVTSTELWGMLAPRLTTQDAKDEYYATVGRTVSKRPGFYLFQKVDGIFKEHFSIWNTVEGTNISATFLETPGNLNFVVPSGKEFGFLAGNKQFGFSGTVETDVFTLEFKNGLLVKVS